MVSSLLEEGNHFSKETAVELANNFPEEFFKINSV
ncbi:MAG: hypothetical protein CM1200mP31_2140 [Candidatus Neomarinimicrobiota bacterium]|nr:MAG: hypothetical protein CM1200mP31_2140 [Candidatus Neomarinimicrobiota bacterium]